MAESVDMTFVATDVTGGTWSEWGSSFKNVTDLVNQAIARLGPNQCIGRLIIATHGAPGGAFMAFDHTKKDDSDEVINGPLFDRTVKAQLLRLRKYFCPDGVVELRVCEMASTARGKACIQTIADLVGVAVTAPEDSIIQLAFLGGISVRWSTAVPSSRGVDVTSSIWRGSGSQPTMGNAAAAGAAIADATPRYVPAPGVPAPAPPGPAVVPENALPTAEMWGGYPGLDALGKAMAEEGNRPGAPDLAAMDEPPTPPAYSILQDVFPDSRPARQIRWIPLGIGAAAVAVILAGGTFGLKALSGNNASSSGTSTPQAAITQPAKSAGPAATQASATVGGISQGGYNPDYVVCILRGTVPGMVFHGTLSGPNIGTNSFDATAGQPSNGRSPASPDEALFALKFSGQGPVGPFTCTITSVDTPSGVTLAPHQQSDWTKTVQ